MEQEGFLVVQKDECYQTVSIAQIVVSHADHSQLLSKLLSGSESNIVLDCLFGHLAAEN